LCSELLITLKNIQIITSSGLYEEKPIRPRRPMTRLLFFPATLNASD
jgi:hypothetical protein